ncbi:MAG TPA: cytochrome c [Pyrinomonadaceae bacterium]|nr:cytochrome c [Pyrinomonadaceae bacterium]
MKTFKLLITAGALALFAAACGNDAADNRATVNNNSNARPASNATPAPAATNTPDELAAAAGDFARFCINCHKADGTGGPFELEDGSKLKVPSLREHGRKEPDKHLADQIVAGGDGMPAFRNRLDEQRINALVRYIRREFHGQTATDATTPSAPSH